MIRKWNIKDDQIRKQCIDEIIGRIDEQGDATFGMLAAQELIDIVAQYIGPAAYNTAIEDARHSMQSKLADLEVELDVLRVTT